MNSAPRATWAPGCGLAPRRARAARARPRARISSCQAGWNSTSSMRLPKRSWVRSCGGFSFASTPEPDRLRPAADRAELARPVRGPVAALAAQRLDQRPVGARRRCGPRAAGPGWRPRGWRRGGAAAQASTWAGSFPVTATDAEVCRGGRRATRHRGRRRSARRGRRAPRRSRRPARRRRSPGPGAGSSPASTPDAITLGEGVAVGAAKDEPLGLDRRIDRLGDQRLGEPAAAQGAAGERLDRGGDPLRRASPPVRAAAAPPRRPRAARRSRKTSANSSAFEGKWR